MKRAGTVKRIEPQDATPDSPDRRTYPRFKHTAVKNTKTPLGHNISLLLQTPQMISSTTSSSILKE